MEMRQDALFGRSVNMYGKQDELTLDGAWQKRRKTAKSVVLKRLLVSRLRKSYTTSAIQM